MYPIKISIIFIFIFAELLFASDSNSQQIDQIFNMSLEELLSVKVTTAGKTPQAISEIPASTVILTRQEIESFGYSSLSDILQNITGLYMINDYSYDGVKFGVRGFWSGVANDNLIILVNNIPQTKNVASNHPLPEIPVPVEAIDRIEVVRGPMSVIYGSGAFFGAINIITNEETDPHFYSSTSIGTSNTHKFFASVNNKTETSSLSINAASFHTDGIDQPIDQLVSNVKSLRNWGITSEYTTGGKLQMKNKYLDINGTTKNIYYNFVLVETEQGMQYNIPAYGEGNSNTYIDYNITTGYKKHLTEKLNIDLKLSYFKDRAWFKYSFIDDNFYGLQQLESNAWDFTIDMFYKPNNKINITFGTLLKSILDAYNLYDIPSFNMPTFERTLATIPQDEEITLLAAFSQIEYKPTSRLMFVAGLRLEKSLKYEILADFNNKTNMHKQISSIIDRDTIEKIPRIAAIYNINNKHIMKLLFGKAINRPSFFQDYLQIRSDSDVLQPEKIETLEFNYQSVLHTNLTTSFSFFHNKLDNLITRVTEIDDTQNYYKSFSSNAGRFVTNGIELGITFTPLNNLYIQTSGSVQNTSDERPEFKDIKVAYSPQKLGYLKARYRINNQMTASILGQYVSSMEPYWDTEPDMHTPGQTSIGRIGQKTDGYFQASINFRYNNLFNKGYFINLNIYNLLDSEIRYPTFTNNRWADKGTLGYGREFMLTLGRKF